MMVLLRILATCMLLVEFPMLVGTLFLPLAGKRGKWIFSWVAGQMLLWAVFQMVCVPAVLLELSFVKMMYVFLGIELSLLFLSVIVWRNRIRKDTAAGIRMMDSAEKKRGDIRTFFTGMTGEKKAACILWGIFAVLFLIQMVCLVVLAYEEGDDAFYVAITSITKDAELMYTKLPYTGGSSGMDARHALAPMPVWETVISWFSGASGAAVAHVILPLSLVPMTYGLYFLLGEKLLDREGRKCWHMPAYLCFVALLILYGGYSTFSAENFLLVRSAQGKSILANLVIPFLLFLFLLLMEKLEAGKKTGISFWVLLCAVMMAGCLCSTLGSLLLCIFAGVAVLCGIVVYRRWSILAGAVCCMLPPAAFAVLYLLF